MVTTKNTVEHLLALVRAIRDHAEFEHHIDKFDIIETHISCILLTGPFAYKFKKPVNFGFLDFSTLELRKFYCEEEIRLNRRLAPELYLEVVPITGSEEYPEIGGSGHPLEYAVKMVQFPAGVELDQLLKSGYVTKAHMEELAWQIAAFHSSIPVAGPSSPHGTPDLVRQTLFENFTQIRPHIGTDPEYLKKLSEVERWTVDQYTVNQDILAARKRDGYIRECHGDMHLGNMILHEGRLIIFDSIEFSANLRWIDVISEVAFLFMDLDSRRQSAFAFRFLNKYLEDTGDYGGLLLLHFYCVYRALVRAKVTCLSLHNPFLTDTGRQALVGKSRHYIDYALQVTQQDRTTAFLIITHGLSGSGKSTIARNIYEYLSAIWIRSDVERKRLFHIKPKARTESGIQSGIYTEVNTQQTYATLHAIAEKVLQAGYPVIVDATFLQKIYRDNMCDIAASLGVPFIILNIQAREKNLQRRLVQRAARPTEISEADSAVLAHQLESMQPLDSTEQQHQIEINTDGDLNYLRIADDVNIKVQQLAHNR